MDVIIIGAGAAGLMAAKILSAKGIKVLVLEARDRLGGRIHTIKEPFSANCEAGAEFIHGNLKLTKELLKEAGLKQLKVEGRTYSIKNGHVTKEDYADGWDILIKQLNKLEKDITIRKFLDEYLPEEKYAATKESFKKYVQGYDSADIEDASAFSIRDEMKNEEDDQFRVENGYTGLIKFLARESTEKGCIIKTGEVVKQINWQKNNVKIITNNSTYQSQKVIISVPPGVLKANEDEEGAIKFYPEIMEQRKAIRDIGFGWVIKLLLEFEEAFWFNKNLLKERDMKDPFFIFSDTFIPTWWTQFPDERPLLVGWLAGPDANRYSNLEDGELLEKAISSIAEIFSITTTDLYKKLTAHQVHNWVSDPFCRGAYSYPTMSTKTAVNTLKEPLEDTLYFAGEALGRSGTGTVDAALQSGKEVADKMYVYLKR